MQVLERAVGKLKGAGVAAHGDDGVDHALRRALGQSLARPEEHQANPYENRKEPVMTALPPQPAKEVEPLPRRAVGATEGPAEAERPAPQLVATREETTASAPEVAAPAAGRRLFENLPETERGHGGGGSGGTGDGSGGTPPSEPRNRKGGIGTWVGAALAIVLIGGVSYWTYKLGQRDAMDVPVIAALDGPIRDVPEETGGTTMVNQGLAVNQVLEGEGTGEIAAEVVTAPGEVRVTSEDLPRGALDQLIATRKPNARPDRIPGLVEQQTAALEVMGIYDDDAKQVIAEFEERVALDRTVEEVKPEAEAPVATEGPIVRVLSVTPVDTETPILPTEDGVQVAEITPESLVNPTVSLTDAAVVPEANDGPSFAPDLTAAPRARPAIARRAPETEIDAAVVSVVSTPTAATPQTDNLDVIPLPSGTRMIQIGAYASEAVAREEWVRFSRLHDDLLGTKEHYVQRTNNSGRIFYRLRVAGYSNKEETRAACAALSARGLPCITATVE